MKIRKTLTILLLLPLFLSGCALSENKSANEGPKIVKYVDDAKKEIASDIKEDVKGKIQSSENAINSNIQSLIGGSIGKLGENVTGLQLGLKDLAHVQATMDTKFTNQIGEVKTEFTNQIGQINTTLENKINLQNQMVASIEAKVEAKFEAKIQALTNINNQMQAKIDAEVEARMNNMIGLSNTVNDTKNETSAGRDNINQNQFTDNMLKSLQGAFWVIVAMAFIFAVIIIVIAVGIIGFAGKILSESRNRADSRSSNFFGLLMQALAKLDPVSAKEITHGLNKKALSEPWTEK